MYIQWDVSHSAMKKNEMMTFVAIWMDLEIIMGFPGGSDGKESAYNVVDLGLIPGLGRSPGEGHGNSLQHSSRENPHGQRSLAGCSTYMHTPHLLYFLYLLRLFPYLDFCR